MDQWVEGSIGVMNDSESGDTQGKGGGSGRKNRCWRGKFKPGRRVAHAYSTTTTTKQQPQQQGAHVSGTIGPPDQFQLTWCKHLCAYDSLSDCTAHNVMT